ncbi:MAG: PAS domain-containing protein [Leptolyngbyaceae bacterium]|nr:PAS domain-containing protein [Leptolyngbyaceae bacterium]
MTLTVLSATTNLLSFIPHGHCYLWKPGLVWLHGLSDGLIALAYFSIPIGLVYFAQQRRDIPYPWLFQMFGAFILSCGLTHTMEIWTLWHPTYWVSGTIKSATAVISLATASVMVPVLPEALNLPSRSELEAMNTKLEEQVRDRTRLLQLSEERLKLALRSAKLGVWDWDIEGDRLIWDNRMQELYGVESANFSPNYETWAARLHPDDLQAALLITQQALASETEYENEFRVVWPDGSVHHLEARALLQRNAEGQPIRMIGVDLDITERKQAEEQRIQAEKLSLELKLLETIFDTVLAGYWDWDIPNHQEYLSPGLKRMLGYDDHELPNVPETWQRLIFEDDLPGVMESFNRHVQSRGEALYYNEVRYRHKDGSTVWVICAGKVIDWDASGQPLRMVGCHVDITQLKQAEEARRQTELRNQALISAVPDLLIWIDAEGTYLDMLGNSQGLKLYKPLPEQVGTNVYDILPQADAEERMHYVRRALETHEVQVYEYQFDIHGELRDEEARIAVCGENQVLCMVRDITKRKRAEAQLIRTTAQLKASNEELEAFAYSVSHDLRSPLRAIDGFSKALLDDYSDEIDEEGRYYFDRIRHNVKRMGMLIDDLLSLSRISRSPMRYESVNLSALVHSQAEDLQMTEPDRQVEFIIAPDVIVEGDRTLITAVISNLLSNAWKFTSHHPIARIEFGTTESEGAIAYFIRDDGAGFDMAYVSKLFDVFQRLHSVNDFPGTGIGLAIVQRAIYRHGGKVWAEAAIEQGTTIYFTIPERL